MLTYSHIALFQQTFAQRLSSVTQQKVLFLD